MPASLKKSESEILRRYKIKEFICIPDPPRTHPLPSRRNDAIGNGGQ